MRLVPVLLLLSLPWAAMAQPRMERAEVEELFVAAGFGVVAGQPRNRCANAAQPKVSFVDLNGDRQAEALFIDQGACYAPAGRYYAVATKQNGRWRQVLQGDGQVKALAERNPQGWLDLQELSKDCPRLLRYDGQRYQPQTDCSGKSLAQAATPAAPAAPTAAATGGAGKPSAADEAALFKAAGFKRKGKRWVTEGCDDPSSSTYGPGNVEAFKDLNGDGRPEAVLSEGGTFCYGNTGQGFWLLSQQAGGNWKLLTQSQGMPDFLATKGKDGFPDIQIGGPGFCFPVVRWNGKEYKTHRWEYEGKACKRPF